MSIKELAHNLALCAIVIFGTYFIVKECRAKNFGPMDSANIKAINALSKTTKFAVGYSMVGPKILETKPIKKTPKK